MNAVAPGLGTDIDDRIAHARRRRVEDLVRIGDTHRHRIDEDIAVICRIEIGLAAHGRHADAIAITADPRDHTLHQMLHLRMVGSSEAQRIGIGHRPRAHGEDIAQNAADACRSTLIGLDVARVVVTLHLEDCRLTITDIDHARILARTADHPRRFGRQLLQMQARALVAAML